ncbi:MAG TPA: GntP family permease [Bacteroidales bacterium]|nr:GntP family permease [Bacteroidales bacterium]
MSLTLGLTLVIAGILLIIALTSWLKINSFLSLFLVSLLLAIVVLPFADIVPALKKGFGDTMGSIGLIIIFGAVIGVTLDKTGATLSIAEFILRLTGKNNASRAIAITGFITGLPIFCDSGFIVLSGINNSLTAKSNTNKVFMATALACALYSVHCLIPPHPGATAAAGIIGANIGNLVLVGMLVALPAAAAGYLWARWMTRKSKPAESVSGNENVNDIRTLPSPGKSILPVLIPLVLITGRSLSDIIFGSNAPAIAKFITFLGDPVIALFIGMVLAFMLLTDFSRKIANDMLSAAIEKAGPIIIITAAGGIFGAIIKATGTGEQAGAFLSQTRLGLLIPFLLAFILKTAQGSSTVAIITTASIIGPMLQSLGFEAESGKLLVMLAMGAGSMMVSHANDSYFWVITNFSGIQANDTLKVYSTSTIIMGVTSFLVVLILSVII